MIDIELNNSILNNFQLQNFEYLVDNNWYNLKSGEQEYRLYAYLSTFFHDTVILDIGTCKGTSAIALSHNIHNKVISYDIANCINDDNNMIYIKENIEFRIKNVLEDLNHEFIKNIKLIVIDIDHYGNTEKEIIDKLIELQFSGIIILDDVFNHPDENIKFAMNNLWNILSSYTQIKTYDVTKYAHWSGTGVILMNTDINLIFN